MTREEIKEQYSMSDVLSMYGLKPNRNGFILCPFHKEKSGSFKVYKDSFHCFGCGAHGDIFDFIMRADGCDFKSAFVKLGGVYENFKGMTRQERTERLRDIRTGSGKEVNPAEWTKESIEKAILSCENGLKHFEKGSDEWIETKKWLAELKQKVGDICVGSG